VEQAAHAFGERDRVGLRPAEEAEEMDILHESLTREVEAEEMSVAIRPGHPADALLRAPW
jgi:hypothetical protein